MLLPVQVAPYMLQIGNLAEAEAAFSRGLHLGSSDRQAVQALRVLAHMKQGIGEHSEAVKVLTRALDVGVRDQMVQCHFLRGGLAGFFLCLACILTTVCREAGRHKQMEQFGSSDVQLFIFICDVGCLVAALGMRTDGLRFLPELCMSACERVTVN